MHVCISVCVYICVIIYIYIYECVCLYKWIRALAFIYVCVCTHVNIFLSLSLIYMCAHLCIYEVYTISFQTFFVWALLLIVHTWNSSPLRSNLLRLQCTSCTVPTSSGRPHGSPFVWACLWPSSQPLSSPQLSHNDSLWA